MVAHQQGASEESSAEALVLAELEVACRQKGSEGQLVEVSILAELELAVSPVGAAEARLPVALRLAEQARVR